MTVGTLTLADGTRLTGDLFGGRTPVGGEVVFTTGMVGYPETLTDPSYHGQIVVLTYPLVGNYGVPTMRTDVHGLPVGFESERIQAAGVVVWEHATVPSHHAATETFDAWLRRYGVPGIAGIDTRALTAHLRAHGAMLGTLEPDGETAEWYDPNASDVVAQVTCPEVVRMTPSATANGGRPPVAVLVDCGAKASIARCLLERGFEVVRVPYDHYFLDEPYDALVVSNGPGDPQRCGAVIRNIERALALGRPILGICLGHQLLALAAGADTFKLPFGHRSQNQPCLETDGARCVITSQNHGFAIRRESLPGGWKVWFTNANDGTVEGIRHTSRPFYGVQFHPEANPGPVDAAWVFDELLATVQGGGR